MKSPNPSQNIIEIFEPIFRIHAHQLIHIGYSDARPQMTCDDKETTVTGYIAEAIQNRLSSPTQPSWYKYYNVKDDPPIPTEGRTGSGRRKLDIILESSYWNIRPQYGFEAKRLRKNGFPASKYVGPEGMGCFISGSYASRYPEAAMLGYIQSDSVEQWQKKVIAEIDEKADILHLKSPQQNIKVIDEFPNEWISDHNRDSVGYPITIYHILLKCC